MDIKLERKYEIMQIIMMMMTIMIATVIIISMLKLIMAIDISVYSFSSPSSSLLIQCNIKYCHLWFIRLNVIRLIRPFDICTVIIVAYSG